LGITSFLSIGAEGLRTALVYSSTWTISSTYKWDVTFRFDERTILALNFGQNYYSNYNNGIYIQPVADVILRSDAPNHYSIYGEFLRMDASQAIYSSYLILNRLRTDLTKVGGYYQFKTGLKITTDATYLSFSDANIGYNAALKIGKYFYPDFMLGYEYYTSGYRRTTTYYYSPISYSSSSIFADWDIIKESSITVTIGGLLGFVANSSYILRQGYANALWKAMDKFTIVGRIAGGSSFQNTVGYSSFSAILAAYWSL
jgi:hypothetical protein